MIAPRRPVPTRTRPLIVAIAMLVWPTIHGCDSVTGGAIEASWYLRDVGGAQTSCADAHVGTVRLWWEVERTVDGSVNRTRRYDAWTCGDTRGVTGFDLPPGPASLWLEPVCDSGNAPAEGTYRTPSPIVRTITEGEVITLVTQLVEVRAADCGTACTCP